MGEGKIERGEEIQVRRVEERRVEA